MLLKVETCEAICLKDFESNELYIRVMKDNEAAIRMYTSMGYEYIENPGDPPGVRLMKKDLNAEVPDQW